MILFVLEPIHLVDKLISGFLLFSSFYSWCAAEKNMFKMFHWLFRVKNKTFYCMKQILFCVLM